MMVSTRGRYALRVMVDLARHTGENRYVPMKEVAERQEISLKYLEKILPALVKSGMVVGVHGKGGGYKLTRPAEDCTVLEILRLTEGDPAPLPCAGEDGTGCRMAAECPTRDLWAGLQQTVNAYLGGITLADLVSRGTRV